MTWLEQPAPWRVESLQVDGQALPVLPEVSEAAAEFVVDLAAHAKADEIARKLTGRSIPLGPARSERLQASALRLQALLSQPTT